MGAPTSPSIDSVVADVVFDGVIKSPLRLQKNTVYVPAWEHAGGLNDRFAMATPSVAEQLGNRLFFTFGTCGSLPVHSEQYTKRFVETNKLKVVKIKKFRFYRVRAGGEVAERDLRLLVPCDRPALNKFVRAHNRTEAVDHGVSL
jgi:hypothetical protein